MNSGWHRGRGQGRAALREDQRADAERERVGQDHRRDHVDRRDQRAQQRTRRSGTRARARAGRSASRRAPAPSWSRGSRPSGRRPAPSGPSPARARGGAARGSRRSRVSSVNGSWSSVTRTRARRPSREEPTRSALYARGAAGDLREPPGVDQDVDRAGLAGRELLLQPPQPVDGLRLRAELLAEVERAAVVEVAERAGDQHREHGGGSARAGSGAPRRTSAPIRGHERALAAGGRAQADSDREQRGQQRDPGQHGDRGADREHRAHPARRVVVGDAEHEHHHDDDPARGDDRRPGPRSATAIAAVGVGSAASSSR